MHCICDLSASGGPESLLQSLGAVHLCHKGLSLELNSFDPNIRGSLERSWVCDLIRDGQFLAGLFILYQGLCLCP